jgi:Uncharacterised nucleotidyltransferase
MGLASDPVAVTPDQRLLLRAALDEPGCALRCFAEWWDHVEIEHTGTTEYRLLPLVYNNIGRLIPDKVAAARIKGVAKHVWLSNHRNTALGTVALDQLIAANVPTLILKGSAMMLAVSAENMRSMGDCDILVPVERTLQAFTALAEVGLRPPFDVRHFTTYDFKTLNGLGLRRSGEQAYHLDIHWRPLEEVASDDLTHEFFNQSVTCILSGRITRRPCFEHMLLHSVVHGTGWAAVSRYDWLADAVLILREAGSKFDWDRLVDTAKRYRLATIIHAAMNELMQTFDIAIPIPAFGRLSRCHIIDRAEARWRTVDPTRVPALSRYVTALQKLRRQDTRLAEQPVWAIWRHLFGPPPRALMRPTMAANDDDHVIFLSGWSSTEPTGRWTDGPLAVLAIQRAPGRGGTFLRLEGQTIHAEPNKPQVIDVWSGWRRLARLSWKTGAPETHVIPLPPALYEREVLTVLLHVRSPIAPANIGSSPDQRQLGLHLRDIRSSHCVRDAATAALDLRHGSGDRAVLWSGWSTPEPGGCWTDGPDALVRWISPRDLARSARLVIRGFAFSPGNVVLTGTISINGRRVGTLSHLDLASRPSDLSLPLEVKPGERQINVHIHLDNPRSPPELGLSPDERRLGLFLQSIHIEADAPC